MENYQKDFREKPVAGDSEKKESRFEYHSGRVLAGLIIVVVGTLLLARQAGVALPHWIFSWGFILMGAGLFVGARRNFRGFTWVVLMAIGGVLFVDDFVEGISLHEYIWPIVIITVGLIMIVRPRNKSWRRRDRWRDRWQSEDRSSDDSIDSVSIFGGTKKNVISKDFKGGDLTTFFGGNELNLMQADFQGTVTIDVTQMFGGTKLIVPAHWNIKSDVVCIFGSVEDKRQPMKETPDASKLVRLDGTCIFGGIEIKSY